MTDLENQLGKKRNDVMNNLFGNYSIASTTTDKSRDHGKSPAR